MATEIVRPYTHGEAYTLRRLDHALSLRHNLEQLTRMGILEKRVFLRTHQDPNVEVEHRIVITPRLMYGLERSIWGMQASAIQMGLQREVVDIVSKYLPKDNGGDTKT